MSPKTLIKNHSFVSLIDCLYTNLSRCFLPTVLKTSLFSSLLNTLFDNKIKILCQELDAKQLNLGADGILVSESCCSSFKNFCSVTESQVIRGSKIKSCFLDPLPACLTADNLDLLLPHITKITNMSPETGVLPSALKSTFVTPILKKPNLDPEIMKNYRRISSLAFLGKVIERCATNQFVQYLDSYNLFAFFSVGLQTVS